MKITKKLLVIASFFSTICLQAGNQFEHLPDAVKSTLENCNNKLNLEGEPSAIVGGCVNAMTGSFIEREVDLMISGSTPMDIVRKGCIGGTFKDPNYLENLRVNCYDNAYARCEKYEDININNAEDRGGSTQYVSAWNGKHHKTEISVSTYGLTGITNTAEGTISARTNKFNNKAYIESKPNHFHILTCYGSRKNFIRDHSATSFVLDREIFLSGLQTAYSYTSGKNNLENKVLVVTKKALLNRAGQESAFVQVDHPKLSDFKKQKRLYIWGSNHTHVGYEFSSSFPGATENEFRLTHVIKPFGVEVWYEWVKDSQTPSRKIWPEGRFISFDTYKKGKFEVGGETITIKDTNDARVERIRAIGGPVGSDHHTHKTYRFLYHLTKKEGKTESTDVFDCYNNKTVYTYTKDFKIQTVSPMLNDKPYITDRAYWNGPYLLARGIEYDDKTVVCTYYNYGNGGNPIKINFLGNLTGRSDILPVVKKDLLLAENGCEKHVITSAYTQDGRNLKIEENDGQKITRFQYLDNTDILIAKFICSLDGVIRERLFYEVDANLAVTLEIQDDGSTTDKGNLTDVTFRLIKRITTSQTLPIGYPLEILTSYLDIATGSEVLLNRETRSYDHRGNPIHVVTYDPEGNVITSCLKVYDNRNNVTSEKDVLGREIVRHYDANNNLRLELKPGCPVTVIDYDFSNRPIESKVFITQEYILSQKYRYDYLGRKIEEISPQGESTRFEYDFLGRLVKSTQSNGEVSTIAYNRLSQPVEMVDGQGRKLKIAYNCRHKPIRMDYPNGTTEHWYYTLQGLLEEHIGISGIKTLYEYDYKERCVKKTIYSPDNRESPLVYTWVYNALNLLEESDPSGITTYYRYDAAGRLVEKECSGVTLHYEYNPKGLLARTIERTEDGHVTVVSRKYDALNRMIEQCDEEENGAVTKRTRYVYNDRDQVIETITEADGQIKIEKNSYGPLGEPLGFVDAEGNETKKIMDYLYRDETGKLVRREQTIDPQGNVLEAHIDGKGNVLRTKLFNAFGTLLKEENNLYDSSGNRLKLEEHITVNGDKKRKVVTQWEYDWFNRLESRTDAVGTVEQKRAQITYNAYGQKQSVTKPDGTRINYTYDGFGRLSEVKSSDGSIGYKLFYDQRGRIVSIDEKDKSTYREYNDRNQLTGETLSNQLHLGYSYDAKGRPTKLILPDSSIVTYEYDSSRLLKINRYDASNNLRYTHQYLDYNADNQATRMQLPGKGGIVTAQYDIQGRTINIGHPLWNEVIPKEGYDTVGNLKSLEVNDAIGSKTYLYDYDAQKQLIKEDDHDYTWDSQYNCVLKDGVEQQHNDLNQLLSDGTNTYHYDLNGNLLNKGEVSFAYDALDRLIKVESSNLKFEYAYDFQNRRVSKCRLQNQNGNWDLVMTERYLYIGDQEIGACNEQNQIHQLRLLGVGLGAEIGASVAIELNGNVYAPIHNHIGHIMALVDIESGETAATYRYSAFGTELTETEMANPWRFASKRKDEETGFYNFGRRYYSPQMMRWLTPDPIDRNGGPNIYAYVMNTPLTSFDLYGLRPMAQLVDKSEFVQYSKLETLKKDMKISTGVMKLGSIVFSVLDGMKSTAYTIVTGVIQVGFGIGKIIGNLYRATEKSSLTKKGFDRVYGWESPVMIFQWGNGVCNTPESSLDSGTKFSALCDNVALQVCCERTQGIIWDLFEVPLMKVGFYTPSVRRAYEEMTTALNNNPNCILVRDVHSKGAESSYQALKRMTPEQRSRVYIAGYGGARMFPKGFCGGVKNYVSKRDSIPFISDPLAHFQPSKYEIEYLDSDGTMFMDHSINSPTYEAAKDDRMKAVMLLHRSLL